MRSIASPPLGRAGTPGVAGDAPPPLLCAELGCRTLFEQARAMSRTEAELPFNLRWVGQARRDEKGRVQLLRALQAREARENAAAHAALAARVGRGRAPDLRLVVPSGHRGSRRMAERRRRAFAAHLDAIIAAALAPPDPAGPPLAAGAQPPATPAPPSGSEAARLDARLCGVCGGGCCTGGGEHAYLKPGTMRIALERDPGLEPATLRAAYLARLPARAIADSCVFHTRHGCALPRDLRSHTCNAFACGMLETLRAGAPDGGPVRSVAVVRRRQGLWHQEMLGLDNAIVGGAVLTPTRTRRVRAPSAEPLAAGE